jgi:hypothetical protein
MSVSRKLVVQIVLLEIIDNFILAIIAVAWFILSPTPFLNGSSASFTNKFCVNFLVAQTSGIISAKQI